MSRENLMEVCETLKDSGVNAFIYTVICVLANYLPVTGYVSEKLMEVCEVL